MSESKKIKTALISVYHKDGLDAIISRLHEEGVQFLSEVHASLLKVWDIPARQWKISLLILASWEEE